MLLKDGAEVFTSDGEKVGEIDRVVIDPASKETTHIVVQKGFLFTTDKVVPISMVGTATEDRVTLREDAGDWDALPDFQETEYVPISAAEAKTGDAPDVSQPIYWYPPAGYTWWGTTGGPTHYGYPIPPYVVQAEKNVPEGTVALREGAEVLSLEGEHVGNIEAVLTDAKQDRATHLLISRGLLLKETKLVPTTWISTVREDEVSLVVGSELLQDLPAYERPE